MVHDNHFLHSTIDNHYRPTEDRRSKAGGKHPTGMREGNGFTHVCSRVGSASKGEGFPLSEGCSASWGGGGEGGVGLPTKGGLPVKGAASGGSASWGGGGGLWI